MSKYLTFTLMRGGEDSAPVEDLNFNVRSDGVDGDQLKFKFDFEKPDAVSIGSEPDRMKVSVVDPSFFAAANSGKELEPYDIISILPRQFGSEAVAKAMRVTKTGVETAMGTITLVQIIITILIAASLKSMWNFMNVMQIVAYMRFFA
jgi:hypothetical protein